MEALVAAGHEVHLLCEGWESPPTGVTVHPQPVRGGRSVRPVAFAQAVESALNQQTFDCVFSLERTLRQDVYRAGDGVHREWLACRRQHAPWWRRPFIGLGAFHRNLCALEAQTFDPARTGRVIVNSRMVGQEIERYFQYPADRMHLVRNGVVTARYLGVDRDAARRRFGLLPGEFVLLFVGSGWERKGLPQLVRAMRHPLLQSRPVRLLVVGKGRLRNAPPNVTFTGPVREVEQAYAAADLLAFLPLYEPSANVIAEALVAGLPVVTSARNGAAEWLRPGIDGEVVTNPEATDEVARILAAWIDRRPGRLERDPAPFDLDRNLRETMAVLEQAAQERRR
jgi:UDP-glucose:(heptosyl)LPS alpha-1,3-glucosyltransferase